MEAKGKNTIVVDFAVAGPVAVPIRHGGIEKDNERVDRSAGQASTGKNTRCFSLPWGR